MKRFLLAATATILTASAALAAAVPSLPKTLRTAGYWSAWYTPSNSEDRPMCGMSSDMDVRSGSASLMLKYTPGGQIFIHVFKSGWRIPDGTRIPVSLVFDTNSSVPWAVNAVGSMSSSGTGLVAFVIRSDAALSFIREFGEANSMTLTFTQGSERPWSFNMIGSKEVSMAFAQCAAAIEPSSSQPYGSAGTTQPFGSPTPPSQATHPFGPAPTQPLSTGGGRDNGGI